MTRNKKNIDRIQTRLILQKLFHESSEISEIKKVPGFFCDLHDPQSYWDRLSLEGIGWGDWELVRGYEDVVEIYKDL